MSADEFDPFVERMFARSPVLADTDAFTANVESRLESGMRVRTLALSLAGLIGGAVAVRESLNLRLDIAAPNGPVAGRAIGESVVSLTTGAQSVIQNGVDQLGAANWALGSMQGMQLFWLAAGTMIALAAAAVMKLSQET
ncbi:hypothetical protein [Brevundimonas sp.]|uniref:hypothetical protein n=1 Tax=Brevundimonas sp. TaxID=1871086 RepID=UPI003BA892CD